MSNDGLAQAARHRLPALQALALIACVAGAYFGGAQLGFAAAFGVVSDQVTLVWPPTGIALAALLLFGQRAWPGVALGAFIANIMKEPSPAVAAGIALGNTLEAVIGAYLFRRAAGERHALTRVRDVLWFVGGGAVLSTVVAATIGVGSLMLGAHPPADPSTVWLDWWVGDAVGALIVAPFLLTLHCWSWKSWLAPRLVETIALCAGVTVIASIVFFGGVRPLEYTVFPFVIWAALRFAQPVTSAVVLLGSGVAILGTWSERGPFTFADIHANLQMLQLFNGTVAITALVLAAQATERSSADRHRATGYAVAGILAESQFAERAMERIVVAVCEGLRWDIGAIWRMDPATSKLRCEGIWHRDEVRAPEFEALSKSQTFAPGVGLPGRVFASKAPSWIEDVRVDLNFPRRFAAAHDGLRSAFGFPLMLGDRCAGVIEFFVRERRERDELLLQMMATLGSQIGQVLAREEADAALRKSEHVLREADRRKNEFLAMLAHELRNPLAPILNAMSIIKLRADEPELIHESRAIVERQVLHMTRLIDDLLDVARLSRGMIQLRRKVVSLESVIEQAIQTSRPLIDARRHALEVAMLAEPVFVDADPVRLTQVFCNLLNNAAKFTDEGGRIGLFVTRERDYVVVRIADNGRGIPTEMLPHVFELFTQAQSGLDRSTGGLGVGLALARQLVELHGGSIDATSAGLGSGSAFTVQLPVAQAPAAGQREPRRDVASSRPRKVLVVDDNVDSADTVALLLRMAGHDVVIAYEGYAALDAARQFRPSVALLDLGLPGLDGFALARTLRQDTDFGGLLRLIAVSGYGSDEHRRQSREAGFDLHIVKPIDQDILLSMLEDPIVG